MIIVVGGTKGGSGKTTVAINLTVMRSQTHDVLLIDADEQESATDFTAVRNERKADGAGYTCIKLSGQAVRTETLRLAPKYEDIIIDVGGRDSISQRAALVVADVLLVPFKPRSLDVWTLSRIAQLVAEARTVNPKLKAYSFLNCADPRGADNEEAGKLLADCGDLTFINAPLGQRKAFSNAASEGLGISDTEFHPTDFKAVVELSRIFDHAFNEDTESFRQVLLRNRQ